MIGMFEAKKRPPSRRGRAAVRVWRWRESNPRPGARIAGVYRFSRASVLSGRAWLRGTRRARIRGGSRGLPSRHGSPPASIASEVTAARGGAAGFRVLPLTRRGRNCRCWQLKVLPNVRTSTLHLRPTTRIASVETGAPPGSDENPSIRRILMNQCRVNAVFCYCQGQVETSVMAKRKCPLLRPGRNVPHAKAGGGEPPFAVFRGSRSSTGSGLSLQ